MTGSDLKALISGSTKIMNALLHFAMLTLCVRWFLGNELDIFLGVLVTFYVVISGATAFLCMFEARRVIIKRSKLARDIKHGGRSRNEHQVD